MGNIKVSDIIENAFSSEQAKVLKEKMNEYLSKNESICLDFEGIDKYTTLFFNFSMGYFVGTLGKKKYDALVTVKHLSKLGESTYYNSYNNAIRDDYANAMIENEIVNILKNQEETEI